MSAFKALLIKDFHTYKKQLFIPVWIVLGFYLLSIAMIFIALAKNPNGMVIGGIPLQMLENVELHRAISFAMQAGLFFGLLGLIFAIPMIISGSTLLNSDIKTKCELFHRSQPISVWRLTASRYIVGIGGYVGLAFLVGLAQMIIGSIIAMAITPLRIDWWMAFNGFMLSWMHLSISLTVIGTIGYLLSSIFKDNAFGKGALSIFVIESAITIINYFLKLGIPSLFKNLFKLIYANISDFTAVFPTMQYGIVVGENYNTTGDLGAFAIPPAFLSSLYSSVFNWDTAGKVLFCLVLYVLATCIYHRREVQF